MNNLLTLTIASAVLGTAFSAGSFDCKSAIVHQRGYRIEIAQNDQTGDPWSTMPGGPAMNPNPPPDWGGSTGGGGPGDDHGKWTGGGGGVGGDNGSANGGGGGGAGPSIGGDSSGGGSQGGDGGSGSWGGTPSGAAEGSYPRPVSP